MTDARSGSAHPGARGNGSPPSRDPTRFPPSRDATQFPPSRDPTQFPPSRDPTQPSPSRDPARHPQSRDPARRPITAFFRANPQVMVLLLVCLVLGLGTFLAVLFGLVTAGSDQTTGEPSGAILAVHATLTAGHWLPV